MNHHATSNLSRYDAKTFKYLQSHKIFSLFETLLLTLVVNKPENPSVFLVEQLKNTAPISIEKDDPIDLTVHNQHVLQTIKSLVSHGLSPTPSFFALFATPSFSYLPGVNEEFKDDDVVFHGEFKFQQEQTLELVVPSFDVHGEGHTLELPSEDVSEGLAGEMDAVVDSEGIAPIENMPDIIPTNSIHPIIPAHDKPRGHSSESARPSSIERDENTNTNSTQQITTKRSRSNDDGHTIRRSTVETDENLNTKPHKPTRSRLQHSNTLEPEESHGDSVESDVATERIEAMHEELTETTKVKRGKRASRNKSKLQSSEQTPTAQDQNIAEDSAAQSTPPQGGPEQNSPPNDSNKINKTNSSFTKLTNTTPSTSNSNLLSPAHSPLLSTDNTPLKSALRQSAEKSPLPTIGAVKKSTSFHLESEAQQEPEPPKPKPNKFQSNTLTKLRYQPQQLPHLTQQIRLQKTDYEQQKLEAQLHQAQHHIHPPLHLSHHPLHAHQLARLDPHLLLHNQLYPQNAEAIPLQPQYPNISHNSAPYLQQKSDPSQTAPQSSPKNQRRNSVEQTQPQDLSSQQNILAQNNPMQPGQPYLPLSNQHFHSQKAPHGSLAHLHVQLGPPTTSQLGPLSPQQIPPQLGQLGPTAPLGPLSPQFGPIAPQLATISQFSPKASQLGQIGSPPFGITAPDQLGPVQPPNSVFQFNNPQYNRQFTPSNMPPASSLQKNTNNSNAQYLPKLAPNSEGFPKEKISTSHLPPLTETHQSHNYNSQQLPHIFAQNQQHVTLPLSQQTLPDISQAPQKSPHKQRMQRVDTPYYSPHPHHAEIYQDEQLHAHLPLGILLSPRSSLCAPPDLSHPHAHVHFTPSTHTTARRASADFSQHVHGHADFARHAQHADLHAHGCAELSQTQHTHMNFTEPEFEESQDLRMHSAPQMFQGTEPDPWISSTGSEQTDDRDQLSRSLNDISISDDASSPQHSPNLPPPAFHGVHYHTPARPRSPHYRRKPHSTTSPIQINAHTNCNHAHRSHNKLTRSQSR